MAERPKNPHKPGSGMAKCWEVYTDQGADACFNHGVNELGLAASSLRAWIRYWGKQAGKEEHFNPNKPDGPVKMYTKDLITVKYIKDKERNQAYLIAQGPQASIVRFQHNGAEQCIANNWLGLPTERRSEPTTIQRRYDI
jgi:hypothetical protein